MNIAKRKLILLSPLAIPIGFLLIFTFGEIFSGDISGLSHLIQILPIVLIGILAYKKPKVGGLILILLGLIFGILYATSVPFELKTIFLVEIILFFPLIVSGLFLLKK